MVSVPIDALDSKRALPDARPPLAVPAAAAPAATPSDMLLCGTAGAAQAPVLASLALAFWAAAGAAGVPWGTQRAPRPAKTHFHPHAACFCLLVLQAIKFGLIRQSVGDISNL